MKIFTTPYPITLYLKPITNKPSQRTMSAQMITDFINAVNAEFLKGKKLDELTALWKRISTVPKCPALVKAGAREGQPCGKSCVKDQEFCLCHMPREPRDVREPRATCTVVLKSGKRQGEPCNKPCAQGTSCASHSKTSVPANEPSSATVSAPVAASSVSSVSCNFVFTKGPRKGKPCGANSVQHTTKCKNHALLEPVRPQPPQEQKDDKEEKEPLAVATAAVAAVIPALSIIIPEPEPELEQEQVRTNEPKSPDYPPPPHIIEQNNRLIAAQQQKDAQAKKAAQDQEKKEKQEKSKKNAK
jgi:hypothetical protein